MQLLEFALVMLLSVRFVRKLTGLIFLWWRKEYRTDRMLIHLKTGQGKSLYRSRTDWLMIALVLAWFVPGLRLLSVSGLAAYALVLTGTYLLHAKSWVVPDVSPKVIALFLFFFLLAGMLARVTGASYIGLAIADAIMFPASWVFVMLIGLPTRAYHAYKIRNAMDVFRRHAPMTVIGITGSYGKTSVKDYLATILSERYETLKTLHSRNSPIGIAERILSGLTDRHEVFVVEMGAYKKGEIEAMTRMVKPRIGIVTAVNAQHQDLFGSLDTTAQAKYELIAGLTGDKTAILNFDNPFTRAMGITARKSGCRVRYWSTDPGTTADAAPDGTDLFRVTDTVATARGISFSVRHGRETVRVTAPVIGAYQAGNLCAAIIAADSAGMTLHEAARAARNVKPADKVMRTEHGIHGSTFIDDTFNNNPDAALAAIEYLKTAGGKKYLVFQPMIELGGYADTSHERVGMAAGTVCDSVILTNGSHYGSFAAGMKKAKRHAALSVMNAEAAADYIAGNAGRGDTVLFKGKDAEHVLNLLRARK